MKKSIILSKFVLSVLVVIPLMLVIHSSSYAEIIEAIIVTDNNGERVKLTEPGFGTFEYPQSIDLIISTSPKQIAEIDSGIIEKAIFNKEKKGNNIQVSVTTLDGKVMDGILDMGDQQVQGKGSFGEMHYMFTNIKSLEFIRKPGKSYYKGRYYDVDKWNKWKLIDGNNEVSKVEGLCIIDSYKTHRIGNEIYKNKWFPTAILMCDFCYDHSFYGDGKIRLRKGVSEIDVAWNTIKSFEITGKIVEGKPEVILVAKDGSSLRGQLLMLTYVEEGGKSAYGSFEKEDWLAWRDFSTYSTRRVSLFPLRKIKLERME